MKLNKIKIHYILAFSIFASIFQVSHLFAETNSSKILSEQMHKELYAKNKKLPILYANTDGARIIFGLVKPTKTYKVFEITEKEYNKLLNTNFSYSTKFKVEQTNSKYSLKSDKLSFNLGQITFSGNLESYDGDLSSFKYANVKNQSYSLLQIGNDKDIAGLALLTANKSQIPPKKTIELFYSKLDQPATLLYSESYQAIFKYSTLSFEHIQKLSDGTSSKDPGKTILALGDSLGYWQKYIKYIDTENTTLIKQSEILINTITNFTELYINKGLTKSEIIHVVNYLHSTYPSYYELLSQIKYDNLKNTESRENTKLESNKSKKKSASKNKNNKSSKQASKKGSKKVALRAAKIIKKTPISNVKISYKAIDLPKYVKVSPDTSVSTPCKTGLITHPHQTSNLLQSLNCAGGAIVEFDAGPLRLVYDSTQRDVSFLNVPGLMPAFAERITENYKHYINPYSKRDLVRSGSSGLKETVDFWGEDFIYKIENSTTISVQNEDYEKEFKKISGAESKDFYLSRVLDKKGKVISAFYYDSKTLDPVRIQFRNDPKSTKLDNLYISVEDNLVEITSSLPSSEFSPISMKLKTVKLPYIYRDSFHYKFDEKKQAFDETIRYTSPLYEWDKKLGKFILVGKPIPNWLYFNTITYIHNPKNGDYTTFAWDWDKSSIDENGVKPWEQDNLIKPLIVAIKKINVTEANVQYEGGTTIKSRNEDIIYQKYFGLTTLGQVTYRGEGEIEEYTYASSEIPVKADNPFLWEKIKYTSSSIALSDKFGRTAEVHYKSFKPHLLISKQKSYNGLGFESYSYGDPDDQYYLDKITDPAYELVYDRQELIKKPNSLSLKFKTNYGREEHTSAKSGSAIVTTSKFFDKQNVELKSTKLSVDDSKEYSKYELSIGKKDTIIQKSGDVHTFVVKLNDKTIQSIKKTINGKSITVEDLVNKTKYVDETKITDNITSKQTKIIQPGFPEYLKKSVVTVAGDNFTGSEKVYHDGKIQSIVNQTLGKTEYQIKETNLIPDAGLWQEQISGALDNDKRPFGSLSIVKAPAGAN
jgi:hypothetical protein